MSGVKFNSPKNLNQFIGLFLLASLFFILAGSYKPCGMRSQPEQEDKTHLEAGKMLQK